jgi:hypothetical protein
MSLGNAAWFPEVIIANFLSPFFLQRQVIAVDGGFTAARPLVK